MSDEKMKHFIDSILNEKMRLIISKTDLLKKKSQLI